MESKVGTVALVARPRNLIFDLDGTLVDSAPDLAAAVNSLLGELEAPALTEAAVRSMIGDGVALLVRRALAAAHVATDDAGFPAALERFRALYDARLTALTRPYPQVPETLALLTSAGHRLGVCTNKPLAPTRRILEELGLAAFFGAVIGGDSLPQRKPAPEPLLAAIAALGSPQGDRRPAAMIGDSANDMLCARAAAVTGILIPSDYGAPATAADLTLAHFAELPEAVARL